MFWKRKSQETALLEAMYERYEQKMYAAAFSILHNNEQAEDVVQDSFIKLVPYLKNIESVDTPGAKQLGMRILKTTAIDQYRKNHRRADREENWEIIQNEEGVDIFTQSVEDRIFIKTLLEELPADYLEIIRLRCYYGFSAKETAEILGISPVNVAKKLERARKLIAGKAGKEDTGYDKKLLG